MKNNFTKILTELNDSMTNKVSKLDSFDVHTQGRINVNKKIIGLKTSAEEILKNYSDNPDMFINFKKRANEIMIEVEDLS